VIEHKEARMARILLADEDYECLGRMGAALTGDGHEVIEVYTGKDAFDTVLEQQPDLVFLATKLAVFNGFEVCEMLREDPDVPKELPIVILYTADPDTRQLERIGATDALAKNHMVVELRDLVVKYLGDKAAP